MVREPIGMGYRAPRSEMVAEVHNVRSVVARRGRGTPTIGPSRSPGDAHGRDRGRSGGPTPADRRALIAKDRRPVVGVTADRAGGYAGCSAGVPRHGVHGRRTRSADSHARSAEGVRVSIRSMGIDPRSARETCEEAGRGAIDATDRRAARKPGCRWRRARAMRLCRSNRGANDLA